MDIIIHKEYGFEGDGRMEYLKATKGDVDKIYELVQQTILTIYPRYYPKKVVDFFCDLHNKQSILEDIENGYVGMLIEQGHIVGTGSYRGNHITRVYVLPKFQRRGYGNYIMNCLEGEIAKNNNSVYLESSLSACRLYERIGYKTIKHEEYVVDDNTVLIYEVMEKCISVNNSFINYDGKCFRVQKNTEDGEVNDETFFLYHQKEDIVWASYHGGMVKKGFLLGTVSNNGEMNFYYQHINDKKQLRIGKCHSVPHILENGKIQLHESWEWLDMKKTKGSSIIVEQ